MAGFGFDRDEHGEVELRLHPSLIAPLGQLVEDAVSLITTTSPAPDQAEDPLAALVGIEPDAELPKDPALARLFPDAYVGDDESAAEFRRFTRRSMREAKLDNARLLLGSLDRAEVRLTLSAVEATAWLTALNDVRLVLATRLDITDDDPDDVSDDDDDVDDVDDEMDEEAREDTVLRYLYDLLSSLQASLVDVLAGEDLNPTM
jgi:hypothetical protein